MLVENLAISLNLLSIAVLAFAISVVFIAVSSSQRLGVASSRCVEVSLIPASRNPSNVFMADANMATVAIAG